MSLCLILKIKRAVENGSLSPAFTTRDIINWVREYEITKPDGTNYAKASVSSILSNSSLKNTGSSSMNSKMLGSGLISGKTCKYWFL